MANNEKLIYRSAKISSLISIAGITIFAISLFLSTYMLIEKEKETEKLKRELDTLNLKISNLKITQQYILEFIGKTLSDTSIIRIQDRINWSNIQKEISIMPPGKRKQALLNAILLAWKEIPFSGEGNLKGGFDSPGFIEYILNSVGIEVEKDNNLLLSQNIMNTFERTDSPEPGDLMFYRGLQGNFGLIYLSKGDSNSEGVGIGTLQESSPIGIYKYINTDSFPFIGYYKVKY